MAVDKEQGKKLVGALLDWGLRTGARAVTKAVESVLGDARDAIEAKRAGVESFRRREVDEDEVVVTTADTKGEKKAADR